MRLYNLLCFSIRQASVDAAQASASSPLPFYHIESTLFYILYLVVFPYFLVNVFVAHIVITFQEESEEQENHQLDRNQVSAPLY